MSDRAERIAVTGLGIVSAVGNEPRQFFAELLAGNTGVAPRESLGVAGITRINAAIVPRAAVLASLAPQEATLPWAAAMGAVAARQALTDAGLGAKLGRGGLYVNTILGAPATATGPHTDWAPEALADAQFIANHTQGARVAAIGQALGCRGPVSCMVVPCAGNMAIGCALDALRAGDIETALAGGIEEIGIGSYAAFERIRVIAEDCRPFDRRRDGMAIGEGAAFVLLERLHGARARGARVYAELLAVGNSNDAYDLIAPDPSGAGAALALGRALAAAGISANDVDYINAHGTGTELNDAAEARAIAGVFGAAAARVRVSSTKSATGHTLGAASAVEAVATVLAIAQGATPPTVGLTEADPDFGLGGLLDHGPYPVRVALSNGFGLGGNNSVAAFAAPDGGAPVWESRDVFVHGAGAVAAGAIGLDALRQRVAACAPFAASLERIDFDVRALLGRKRLRHADRCTELLGAAVVTDLGDWPTRSPSAAGVVAGIAHPSFHAALTVMARLQRGGVPRLNPGAVPHSTSNSTASWLAIRTGVTGLNATVATSDCAGLDAIAYGAAQIAHGSLAEVIAAGIAGAGDELWRGLRTHGRTDAAEAAGALWLSDTPDGAWARVAASVAAFAPDESSLASIDCATRALAQTGGGPADVAISGSLAHVDPTVATTTIALRPFVGDTLAAGGALAAALAAVLIRDGDAQRVVVCEASPEGYASAMVLTCPSVS